MSSSYTALSSSSSNRIGMHSISDDDGDDFEYDDNDDINVIERREEGMMVTDDSLNEALKKILKERAFEVLSNELQSFISDDSRSDDLNFLDKLSIEQLKIVTEQKKWTIQIAKLVPVTGRSLHILSSRKGERNNHSYTCRVCLTSFVGVANLKHHFINKHHDLREHIHQWAGNRKRKETTLDTSENKRPYATNDSRQATLDKSFVKKNQTLEQHIAKMIVARHLPMSFPFDPYVKEVMNCCLLLGKTAPPGATVDNYFSGMKSLTRTVDKVAMECQANYYDSIIRPGIEYGATLSMDGRSNIKNDPLLTIGLETLNGFYLERIFSAGASKKDSQYLIDRIEETLMDKNYGKHIVAHVCDNASACVSTGIRLETTQNLLFIRCQTHSLNLVAKHLVKTSYLKGIIEKTEEIVKYIRGHQSVHQIYVEQAKANRLKRFTIFRSVPTRFAYHYIMVDRISEVLLTLRVAFGNTRMGAYYSNLKSSERELHKKVKGYVEDNNIEEELKIAKAILYPIVIVLREIDKGISNISLIYALWKHLVDSIIDVLNTFPEMNPSDKAEILESVAKDWKKFHSPVFGAAFLLNPSFKSEIKEMKVKDNKQYTNLTQELWFTVKKIHLRKNPGVDKYQAARYLEMVKQQYYRWESETDYIDNDTEIYSFWSAKENSLGNVAAIITTIAPSVSNVERAHKVTSLIHTATRNRLSTDRATTLAMGSIALRAMDVKEPKRLRFLSSIIDQLKKDMVTFDSKGLEEMAEKMRQVVRNQVYSTKEGNASESIILPDALNTFVEESTRSDDPPPTEMEDQELEKSLEENEEEEEEEEDDIDSESESSSPSEDDELATEPTCSRPKRQIYMTQKAKESLGNLYSKIY